MLSFFWYTGLFFCVYLMLFLVHWLLFLFETLPFCSMYTCFFLRFVVSLMLFCVNLVSFLFQSLLDILCSFGMLASVFMCTFSFLSCILYCSQVCGTLAFFCVPMTFFHFKAFWIYYACLWLQTIGKKLVLTGLAIF